MHFIYRVIFTRKFINYALIKGNKYRIIENEDDKDLPLESHIILGIPYSCFGLIFNYKVFL